MINIVYLILIYVIICFFMILFNVLAIFHSKGSSKLNKIKIRKYKEKIKEQFKRIEEGFLISEEHIKYLKKKLKYGTELIIFDSIISDYKKRENAYIDKYLNNCKSVFTDLMYYYDKRSSTEKAYFLSIIRDYNLLYKNKSKEIERILFDALNEESIYCRDNAYLAICKMGKASNLCKALINISSSNKYFHKNLLINGLNIYNGNLKSLNKLLVKYFDEFRIDIKCCVIEYLSYSDGGYNDFVFELLLDKNLNRKLKLSAIKYFEYSHYYEAEKLLISYVLENLDKDVELCLVSVSALRNYTSNNSINTIKKAIHSKYFKIRDMACESLAVIRLGLNSKELDEFNLEDDITDMYNYYIRKNTKKVK